MAPILLHGTLHVTIYNIKGLINTTDQGFTDQLEQNIEEKVTIAKGVTNLYVTIDLEKAQVGRTRIMGDQEHTSLGWNESFHIYCAHMTSNVVFKVKDGNPSLTTSIRAAYVPVKDILDGEEIDRWVTILDEHKKPTHGCPKIHVKLQYFDVTKESNWDIGIGSPKFSGVPNTFFPQREGCNVSLYQDAHVPDNFVPKISLARGQTYQPQRCWEDVFDAINDAKHLIYITGWSVYTEISLVRDPSKPKSGGDTTLGKLLKKKADQGVTVLMLIWNDKTGLMAAHHKETTHYFRGTKVHCVSCPCDPNDGRDLFKNSLIYTHHQKTLVVDSELPSRGSGKRRIVSFVGGIDLCDGRYDTQFHSLFKNSLRDLFKNSLIYTHHQKTLVVDSELPSRGSGKRRIVSFVGGIDLCDGRYDTQFHSLFRTLDTVHRGDFHQPNFCYGIIRVDYTPSVINTL